MEKRTKLREERENHKEIRETMITMKNYSQIHKKLDSFISPGREKEIERERKRKMKHEIEDVKYK